MAITVLHTKVSTIPDDADTTLVRPSDWNASHSLSGVGTMAEQNANAVAITGGTITNTTLPPSGITAGTYGTANTFPIVTVNAAGVITSATTGTIPNTYQGTWNASTNSPTIVSSVGTAGYYYVVATAGNTTINGVTGWLVGDWIAFNGSVWQKIAGMSTFASLTVTGVATLNQCSVGTTSAPSAMYSGSPFGTAVPTELVYKDLTSASGGSALINIQGQMSNPAATRVSGINFALSNQTNATEYNKSGSVYVKATDAFANTSSLYIACGNIDSISIPASTGLPTFLQGLTIPSGKTLSGAGYIAINGTTGSNFSNSSGSKAITTNSSVDGDIIVFDRGNVGQGSISVSAGTVSYNAFAGSHWSQLHDGSKPTILRGTVLEAIDELVFWPNEPLTEKLCKVKISDTVASKKVYGVFMAWDEQWTLTNDMFVTAVGAFICRIAANQTVQVGDLLESNGDGTARVQADDLIRSSTIGKVTTTVKTHEYSDGTYCVPTVLYCG